MAHARRRPRRELDRVHELGHGRQPAPDPGVQRAHPPEAAHAHDLRDPRPEARDAGDRQPRGHPVHFDRRGFPVAQHGQHVDPDARGIQGVHGGGQGVADGELRRGRRAGVALDSKTPVQRRAAADDARQQHFAAARRVLHSGHARDGGALPDDVLVLRRVGPRLGPGRGRRRQGLHEGV